MNNETWSQMPADVRDDLKGVASIDESIPTGIVEERTAQPGGSIFRNQMPVTEFVAKRRKRARRKQERQNKRAGRVHA